MTENANRLLGAIQAAAAGTQTIVKVQYHNSTGAFQAQVLEPALKRPNEWGPMHPCPACGQVVQWYRGRRRPRPTVYELDTNRPHRCPAAFHRLLASTAYDFEECTCGQLVGVNRAGQKLEIDTGGRHSCTKGSESKPQRIVNLVRKQGKMQFMGVEV